MTALVLLLAACSSSPQSIRVEEPLLIFEPSPQTLDAAALDKSGEPLEDVAVTIEGVTDPDVVELGKDGRLRCASSGSTTLTLAAGAVRRDVEVNCALVKEIRVLPNSLERVLLPGEGGAPQAQAVDPIRVEVVDLNDTITTAVPVRSSSSDPKVVKVTEAHGLELLAPGAATVSFLAGDKAAKVEVVVGMEVLTKTDLVVASRDEHGFPLQPGRYRASLGADNPVSLSFSGTDCESERGTEVKLECTLDKTSTVVVENHPGLSFGKDASVKLRVVKLP